MTRGTGQGWFDWLQEWLPGWAQVLVLIVVVLVGTLLLFESLRKRIAGAANGWRWVQSLKADPRGTIAETVNPPLKPGLSPEEQAQLDRIEAKLDGRESGTPPDPEQRERRDRAVRDIVTDPDPDARAAADELASDQGDIDSAVLRLEHDARTATAEGAAKWRRIGDLVAGFDTTRALHAYEEAFRLQPDDFWTVVLLARQRRTAGDLAGALEAWEAAQRVAEDDREHMITFGETSTSLLEAGRLEKATEVMQETVVAAEQLAASNPGSAAAQRDLSVSLNRLGDVEVQAGDLSAARAVYERSLEVAEQLAASNPGSAAAQRDLSVSLNKLGDVEVQAGDLSAARAAHERSLEFREQLAASNPGSAEAQRDLSVSLSKLGDLEERLGDIGRAIALYQRSLPIAKNLAYSNPSHPGLQRDLEITERRLEELRAKAGAE